MPDLLSVALKEWELQIDALLSGRQPFLLRKGGILESENQFELEHPRFLFFPTVVHQDPRMVKPEFRQNLRQVREEPDRVEIRGYGDAAAIFEVPSRSQLDALTDLYLWDAPLLDMRFAYRPEKPLYLVVVRAFRLPEPVSLQNTLEYAGCKSWIPLTSPIDVAGAVPAVDPAPFQAIIDRVQITFSG